MRISPTSAAILTLLLTAAGTAQGADNHFTVEASAPVAAPERGYFTMGGAGADTAPTGSTLGITSRYLTRDGQPWFPVMGEFHFSRVPEAYWEEEILKLKAGGVDIVATYVFWIHHEEVEGQFDWLGQRDLRRFLELCKVHGMMVWVRIGPWDHGEVRNGGQPDWLIHRGPVRVNDPAYLKYVSRWYDQIGRQVAGLLWKQGGPVIGVQIENEYSDRSPLGGADHISRLKTLALAAGLDVPFYSVTGWDNAVYPPRSVVPVFGGYPDAPWAGSLEEMPADAYGVYQFSATDDDAGILQGAAGPAANPHGSHYPRLTAELGGGLEPTYHRRVLVEPGDIAPLALSALGSGVNLLGYYMYQGGTNPEGRLSTLQESQATGYPNDVPVKSYDFQAPLGEFGQERASYRELKVIHQFLHDFGAELATTTRWLPARIPARHGDDQLLRVAARTDGNRGFLIVNNYVRRHPMPTQVGFQATVRLPSGTVQIPEVPITVPSQTYFLWPINLPLGGALLRYATAQPFLLLSAAGEETYAFAAVPGIDPEFSFAASTVDRIEAPGANLDRTPQRIRVRLPSPPHPVAFHLRSKDGTRVCILVFGRQDAEDAWKVQTSRGARILLTQADVFGDGGTIHLRARDPHALAFGIYPAAGRAGGLFEARLPRVRPVTLGLQVVAVCPAQPEPPPKLGPPVSWRGGKSVVEAPDDKDFDRAATWTLRGPAQLPAGVAEAFLEIAYRGDVARLYDGPRLLDDDFYIGRTWEVGLKWLGGAILGTPLTLKVLPLRADMPFYLPAEHWPDFHGQPQIAELVSAKLVPEYEVLLDQDLNPPRAD